MSIKGVTSKRRRLARRDGSDTAGHQTTEKTTGPDELCLCWEKTLGAALL